MMPMPDWLHPALLARVRRIDLGLEGDWSATVACVWSPDRGSLPLPELPMRPGLRPCLELYMDGGWIGLHCFVEKGSVAVLDRARARAVIEAVNRATRAG